MYEKSTKGQFLFIRHGETEYNQALNANNCKETQVNEVYIDSSLCEEGIAQAKELSQSLIDMEIKTIFCSPLNRCLETIFYALRDHPQKESIRIIVHPLISEVVHGMQDLTSRISLKKEIYNDKSEVKYDWSIFDEYFSEENGDNYFLDFIDNYYQAQDIINNIKTFNFQTGSYNKLLSKFIYKDQRPESLTHLLNRSKEFKTFIKNYFVDDNKINGNEKVLIVTHSAFIRMATSVIANNSERVEKYPEDCYRAANCEITTINI
jgi:broad specificity phosphatase PhoE